MDPLSDLLALLRPQSHVSAGFDAGGAWSVRFADQHARIKCYAVVAGGCWLAVEGEPPLRLAAGDCFVLPSGRPFRLASDLALPPQDAGAVFPPSRPGGVVTLNGGGGLFLVGSRFSVEGPAAMLLGLLPPVVHIRGEADQAALRWAVERMREELRAPRPGGALIAQHLAQMMLIQALRLEIAAGAPRGWLSALADKRLGAALAAIHAAPAHPWTLAELAQRAAMSRSTFAQQFQERVGEPPIAYLTRWRMLRAADRLAASAEPVATVAAAVGYQSESAFSAAFKRVMGRPPRAFVRGR